jgi:hypothetical protein
LLVGDSTRYLYKFVKWEIEQAISRQIPIIAVNLNGKRQLDPDKCPPILNNHTAIHISFNQKIIEHALNNWVSQLAILKAQGKSGPFFYNDNVYKSLGV